jgi:hypothetical protein
VKTATEYIALGWDDDSRLPFLTYRRLSYRRHLPKLTRKSRLLTNNGLAELCDNVDRMWINDDMWALYHVVCISPRHQNEY